MIHSVCLTGSNQCLHQKIQLHPIHRIFGVRLLFAFVSYQTLFPLLLARDYKQKAAWHQQGQTRQSQALKPSSLSSALLFNYKASEGNERMCMLAVNAWLIATGESPRGSGQGKRHWVDPKATQEHLYGRGYCALSPAAPWPGCPTRPHIPSKPSFGNNISK